MSSPIGQAERDRNAALRARHTCMRDMSSMHCRACNAGVPYPAESVDDMLERMGQQRTR